MGDIYQGFYKSSDDKVLAGVCGGLAHKLHINVVGLRLIFFLLAFCWVGLVYVVLWLVLKPAPTKNILFTK